MKAQKLKVHCPFSRCCACALWWGRTGLLQAWGLQPVWKTPSLGHKWCLRSWEWRTGPRAAGWQHGTARLLWGPSCPRWVLSSGSSGRATAGAAWQCLFVPVVELDAELSQVLTPGHQIRLLNLTSWVLAVPQNYRDFAFHRHLIKTL